MRTGGVDLRVEDTPIISRTCPHTDDPVSPDEVPAAGAHQVADVGQREPQREHDGQQQQVRGLFPSGFRPLQRQRFVLLLFLLLVIAVVIIITVFTPTGAPFVTALVLSAAL